MVLISKDLPLAIWLERHTVDRSEVALHTTKLVFKDHVVEAGIELAYPCGRCCDVHGFLSTAQHHLVTTSIHIVTWQHETIQFIKDEPKRRCLCAQQRRVN